jgi:membrane associated rhomboid family serine protease
MTESTPVTQPTVNESYKKYVPVITFICCLVSVILFIGINLEENLDDWNVYRKWGAPSSTDIFDGSYWGLISSNFLHVDLWHIGFNVYWLWIFGKKIEFESKNAFYVFLILSSAFVSSVIQLSFADSTGIGLSGIGYSLFGYILIKSRTEVAYKDFLDKRTIMLFLLWLVLCICLTQFKLWEVGNAAHVGGLIWGMFLAFISRVSVYKQWVIATVMIAFIVSSIFWNPLSISWLSHEAYELHKNQKADEAIDVYKKILSRDADNEFAKANLKQLEIHKLGEKAFELHKKQKYKEARLIYNEILSLDSNDQWTKDNLKILPVE